MPDVIISDLGMPNMSGFELLSVVRRRFPHVPVIAISAKFDGSPNGVIADGFFSKAEYAPEQLFAKIGELLENSRCCGLTFPSPRRLRYGFRETTQGTSS